MEMRSLRVVDIINLNRVFSEDAADYVILNRNLKELSEEYSRQGEEHGEGLLN